MRLPAAAVCLLLAACGAEGPRTPPPNAEELRLMAYLTHDGYVVIDTSERDADGRLIVTTRQGNTRQRYLLAPDDPARPELRLRRLQDECSIDTLPNDRPGINPGRR